MCAGVQNESRPMERCQEISQCTPTIAEVTASAHSQMYHGAFMDKFLLSYFLCLCQQNDSNPGRANTTASTRSGRWSRASCGSSPTGKRCSSTWLGLGID